VGLNLLATGAGRGAALPFVWGTITAFKEDADLYNSENNPFVFNLDPTGEHVSFLFSDTSFLTFAGNTLWVGLVVSALTLAVGLPAAYSLARLNMRWSGALGIAIFLVYLVPPTLLFISITRVVAILGLQDSTWSLVVIYPTITIPVSVWLLIGFFKAVPRDLEEQAMVDGYSRLGAFTQRRGLEFRLATARGARLRPDTRNSAATGAARVMHRLCRAARNSCGAPAR
jgi:multiple sugar transport system permease protein